MTLKELSKIKDVSIESIIDLYNKQGHNIPIEEDYNLSDDLVKLQLPENSIKYKLWKNKEKDALLNSYFMKTKSEVLETIKQHNSLQKPLLEGYFTLSSEGKFGFFTRVTTLAGEEAFYPITNEVISDVYINSNSLNRNKKYKFRFILARDIVREKKGNPFLIQADSNKIDAIIELNELDEEIDFQKSLLVETKNAINLEKSNLDLINENHNLELSILNEVISTSKDEVNTLFELKVEHQNKIKKMEILTNLLKNRIQICKNLEFINVADKDKFLDLLSVKEFQPENHHDFDKDFNGDFSNLINHVHYYLYHKKNLIYTQFQIRNFLTLLKTHDIIVLSGLSGSGKTQIVKAFAEALGGIVKIIPVKPNWTSSDDLLGYYNPLQMSFLPTPFTEAIAEAIHNPNQLYFICLDEMNLARVEYYFADFLSKLEERNKLPEIDLYAKHEEELFVSELGTLLNLIESSLSGQDIKSWQDFLNHDESRKKFFELMGNAEKESMLQLHSRIKRRLADILKFPATIYIPDNIRFIGAINVDETTHYFSPKIIDRIHIVKFDNPLLFEDDVNNWFRSIKNDKELKPVYVNPILFSKRKDYPSLKNPDLEYVESILKEINLKFLIPLKIDFGIRSIRQCLNYYDIIREQEYRIYKDFDEGGEFETEHTIDYPTQLETINSIIIQKILPRFIFDGNDKTVNGKTKIEVVKDFSTYLKNTLTSFMTYDSDGAPMDESGIDIENNAFSALNGMIVNAEYNDSQFNFFA